MRFPFLFLALSFVLGILLSSLLSLPLFSWILSLAASLTCGWLCYSIHKNKLAFVFILLSTFLLGASLYTSTNINFENNSLRKLEFTSYADFTGKLYKSPSHGQDRDVLFIRVEKVSYQNTEQKIRGRRRAPPDK